MQIYEQGATYVLLYELLDPNRILIAIYLCAVFCLFFLYTRANFFYEANESSFVCAIFVLVEYLPLSSIETETV